MANQRLCSPKRIDLLTFGFLLFGPVVVQVPKGEPLFVPVAKWQLRRGLFDHDSTLTCSLCSCFSVSFSRNRWRGETPRLGLDPILGVGFWVCHFWGTFFFGGGGVKGKPPTW